MEDKTGVRIFNLKEGDNLVSVEREILQPNINLYAEASLDFNPIHIDPAFARETPLGGTIAHGMLVLGYVSHMMTLNFGEMWVTGGKLSVRFKEPARPGDRVTISGTVKKIIRDQGLITVKCDVACRNQSEAIVIAAEAVIKANG